jgi:cytochrome P450
MVLWGIRSSHLRPEIYPEPTKFDPERFGPERHEQDRHPHAFVPNGAGDAHKNHKCAGYEFAPLMLQVFLVELLRGGYRWTFAPDQDLSLDCAKVPPEPRDRMRVRITR